MFLISVKDFEVLRDYFQQLIFLQIHPIKEGFLPTLQVRATRMPQYHLKVQLENNPHLHNWSLTIAPSHCPLF